MCIRDRLQLMSLLFNSMSFPICTLSCTAMFMDLSLSITLPRYQNLLTASNELSSMCKLHSFLFLPDAEISVYLVLLIFTISRSLVLLLLSEYCQSKHTFGLSYLILFFTEKVFKY